MTLYEHNLSQRTKLWVGILAPLTIIFLFINPYVSLLLFSIILGRLIFVEILKSVFEKSIQSSEPKSERDLGHLTEGINNLKMRLREAETKEILALTEDFPNVFIDYDEDTKQYKITYKNKTASFSTYLEIRTWLEHG